MRADALFLTQALIALDAAPPLPGHLIAVALMLTWQSAAAGFLPLLLGGALGIVHWRDHA